MGHWKIEVLVFDEGQPLAEEIFDGIHDLILARWDIHPLTNEPCESECTLDFSLGMGPFEWDDEEDE